MNEPSIPPGRETPLTSPRREELLEKAYAYALEHGVADLSLRPLASAIGSSPRVLLYLFGSKDGLVRALLGRARRAELELLAELPGSGIDPGDTVALARAVWSWLAAPEHRSLNTLWAEGYARSLVDPGGPWADFARATVEDWLALLTDGGAEDPTLLLAVLRGALLDLLATGDVERTTAAVENHLRRGRPA